jgi:ACT domain-containing protein
VPTRKISDSRQEGWLYYTATRRTPRRPDSTFMHEKSNRVIVTVIGEDKVGIIAAVATLLAEANANIIDISQTTLKEFFTMIMMVDMEKASLPFDELKRRLNAKGEEMGLKIDAQHEDVFKFMHRV